MNQIYMYINSGQVRLDDLSHPDPASVRRESRGLGRAGQGSKTGSRVRNAEMIDEKFRTLSEVSILPNGAVHEAQQLMCREPVH